MRQNTDINAIIKESQSLIKEELVIKKACLAVFLCVGLALGLSAGEINLSQNAKIGKTLEGKALQKVLQIAKNGKI
ncbi:hypothetical protein [Helicobacter rodentium]|uniref:hypothetical protein n=1 Tax=Helicobacter rodentium TaxID=59617 RepID=UPI002354AF5F|nr:hypothetical protein [Helicobacter rodentium]